MTDDNKKPELLQALETIERERNLPKEKIIEAIEEALQKAYERDYGANSSVIIELDRDTAALHIWQRKTVVPEVYDPNSEISLDDAKEQVEDAELGMELEFEIPSEAFRRIAAQSAKQVILTKIREYERDTIKNEYDNRKGTILTGTAVRYEHRDIIVDLGRAEGIIPFREQAQNENIRINDRIKAVVKEVVEDKDSRSPRIILSRASSLLLKSLFENQVPEIQKGIVKIKAVAREAGMRSKVAVTSTDPNVDPVGACVGPKGSRVQAIGEELRNERIDIIPWSDDPAEFIANALLPSSVTKVILNENDAKSAIVIVPDDKLPLAIGRDGQNARLAAKLTQLHIDIKNESNALDLLRDDK